jgi:hypothetical protein
MVVLLSASAHVLGGGHASPLAVFLAGCLTLSTTMAVSGRRFTGLRIGGLLVAGQVVFHALFVVFGAPASCGPALGGHGHGTRASAAVTATSCGPAADAGAMAAHHAQVSVGMVAAHLVATVVVTLLLLHGERALWAVWAWLTSLATVPVVLSLLIGAPRPRPGRFFVAPALAFVPRGRHRRGPPAGPFSLA